MSVDRQRRPRSHVARRGLTLVELLLVVVVAGVLATLIIPWMQPGVYAQLRAAGQVVQADLAYARSLAVAHGTSYRITFRPDEEAYVLEHVGSNPDFDTLPTGPFFASGSSAQQHWTRLGELPRSGIAVEVDTVLSGRPAQRINAIEFGPLGETLQAETTQIWLAAGFGAERRYLAVEVDAVTGLARLGAFQTQAPVGGAVPVAPSPPAGGGS